MYAENILNVPSLHAIEVRYLGPTDTKGSRITLKSFRFSDTDFDGNRRTDRVTFSTGYYNPRHNGATGTKEIAVKWLEDHGYSITGCCETTNSFIITTDTFKSLQDAKAGR